MFRRQFTYPLLSLSILSGCAATTGPDDADQADVEALRSSSAQVVAEHVGWGPTRLSPLAAFVVEARSKAVLRIAKTGGPATPVITGDAIVDFRLDETHVYATVNSYSHATGFAEVVRAPIAGGPAETVFGGDLWNARLALDASDIYVASGPTLARFPKSGGALQADVLAQEPRTNLSGVAVDAVNVYWADMGEGNPAVGCTPGEGRILARPKAGGPTRVIALGEDCPMSLTLDNGMLYYNTFLGHLRQVSVFGGLPMTVAEHVGVALAVDATSVHFDEAVDGKAELRKANRFFPGFSRTLATTTDANLRLLSVAVDATSAFYVVNNPSTDESTLYRIAK